MADYDTTVARMAGNIAAGMIGRIPVTADQQAVVLDMKAIARDAVVLARTIVAEMRRMERVSF